jgi:Abnormal spindle-like microcephaly-assoc'd, ASPM-SPD-2-Hydin
MALLRWLGMAAAATAAALSLAAAPARAAGLVPMIDCVRIDHTNNLRFSTWGYANTAAGTVSIQLGTSNFFSPSPAIQGQPVDFDPGVHSGVFETAFALPTSQIWHLDGLTATATLDAPLCATANTAPLQVTAPSVTGLPLVGQPLFGDRGVWGYTATGGGGGAARVDLQWQRQAPGGSWEDIAGATQTTYTPVADDTGDVLRLQVTALSVAAAAGLASGEQTVVQTDPTAAVTVAPTITAGTPTISGSPEAGQTLTADPGAWTGASSFAYDWQRCAASCTSTGHTGTTYSLGAGDAGGRLRVVVTPDGASQPSAASAETDVVRQPSALAVTPTSVDFGSLKVRRVIVRKLVVTNTGSSALAFGGVTRSGPAAADFLTTSTCDLFGSLSPGRTCTIYVAFQPSAKGTRTAQVQAFPADGDPPPPVTLTGVGT